MTTVDQPDLAVATIGATTAEPRARAAVRPMGHVAALDGLRALAVMAVVVYHLPATWLPGGFLGVDVFFVLSGFLITSLLLRGQSLEGSIALGRFWARRARRLFPAAAAMIVGTVVVASVAAPDAMSRLRGDVPASLLYVMNWRLIFHHDSYDQTFGRPPLLEHLWSLGVEEQFYLVWPLVVVVVAWWVRRHAGASLRRSVAAVAFGGAVVSGALMAALVRTGHDPSSVYFDPATHASGLLLGAASAAAFPLWRRSGSIQPGARRVLELLAGVAAAGMVGLLLLLHQQSASSYRGGLQLAAVLSAVIVLVAGHPGTRVARPLSSAPLVWLGRRSYSIYLWHWPIFEMTRPGIDVRLGPVPDLVLRLGLTLLAADLSYRFVEQPWHSGRAQRALTAWWHHAARPAVVSAGGVVGVLGVSVALLLIDAPSDSTVGLSATAASRQVLVPDVPPSRSGSRLVGTSPVPPQYLRALPAVAPPTMLGPVLAIGDSVMLGASADLSATLGPGAVVDAQVGRQVYQGLSRLAQYRAAGRLAGLRAVVVGLGTNGPMSLPQCLQFVSLTSGEPLVLVNVRVPRTWQAISNSSISACAARSPGVVVANWYAASAAAGVIGPDEVHETVPGRALYAEVVTAAVREAEALPQPPPAVQRGGAPTVR